ncbi:Aste57867_8625 [Aphanomyces stellatus]|uniref:Aste57867_8625 protein n=1 Tax=Aphanomyces stellatus TaxID=120398 RepID=A0A485KKW3_9STRA|nr:hypothetical protein As57867_008591 [Aphanomyces stellatus]VFT85511.1 Aste57867_8625 [Aphanomyces stellatus]
MLALRTLLPVAYMAALASALAATIGSDHALALSTAPGYSFSHIIRQPDATYIAPHFDSLDIPVGGRVVVSALDGSQNVTYTGARSNFYAEYVRGDAAVVTYYPPKFTTDDETTTAVAFSIDRFASGFPQGNANVEAICGNDDTKAIVCVKASDPAKYKAAQAVGRLLIGGNSLCTGWLFGSEGHVITNNHCIGDAATAANIQFEFGAECKTCDDPNNVQQLACPGETVASSAKFVYTNIAADFTLVKLNLKSGVDLTKYGYLQARESGPVLNEPIYIPQHPAGKPTRIATVLDNGSIGTVESFSINTCSSDEIGYTLDTEPGASGSPVLSAKENVVVGLHNCGGCLNGAIKIDKVVAELKSRGYLPANAVVGGGPSPSTPSPSPTTPNPTSPVTPKPTPSTPTPPKTTKATPTPPSTTPVSGCGSCSFCYYPGGHSCLTDFSKNDCDNFSASFGTFWCGK